MTPHDEYIRPVRGKHVTERALQTGRAEKLGRTPGRSGRVYACHRGNVHAFPVPFFAENHVTYTFIPSAPIAGVI